VPGLLSVSEGKENRLQRTQFCRRFSHCSLYSTIKLKMSNGNGLLVDKKEISAAYDDVRSDNTETSWLLLEYDDKNIKLSRTGVDYDELLSKFDETNRAYAYVRIMTGDELSRRAKFVLITWIGETVSPLKRARVSTDKTEVKSVVPNFGVEILSSDREEVSHEHVKERLIKAGGANYGTGGD